ncbi:MAG: hypothetical protein KatS3mg124_0100 [Porticoccaceae bacterium]|nr:MAG: hypothetical protein KatS3mg124_0100 [Porticoccaceae bacterium]
MAGLAGAVNWKRALAATLVEQAVREARSDRHRRQALLEGAVFELALAYRFYLGELAEALQLPEAEGIADLAQLEGLCRRRGIVSPEVAELAALEQAADSWLAALLAARRRIAEPPRPASPDLLAGGGPPWLDCAEVAGWRAAFDALVERQRAGLVEW